MGKSPFWILKQQLTPLPGAAYRYIIAGAQTAKHAGKNIT